MDTQQYNNNKKLEIEALKKLGLLPFELEDLAEWQTKHKLVADGKCGPSTWAALRKEYAPSSWLRTLPHGLNKIKSVYGEVGSTQLVQASARHVGIHKLLKDEFDFAFPIAIETYNPKMVQTYNKRYKRGGDNAGSKEWSTHSWGIAFDVDPGLNVWGNKPTAPIVVHPEFAAVWRVLGWSCGTDWATPDTMHVQACTGY